jgi:hypothetical protein
MRRTLIATLIGACAAAALAATAHAQAPIAPADATGAAKEYESYTPPKDANVFKFDYGVPSSPALTLLGIDEKKVTQSNSLKPFVVDVLPGLLSGNNSDQAVSLDFAPAHYLLPASQQRFSEYASGLRSLLFRTRVSGAAYGGVDDADATKDKRSRLALGLSASLLNTSDPLLAPLPGDHGSAFIKCLDTSDAIVEAALLQIAQLPTTSTEADRLKIWNAPATGAGEVLGSCKSVSDMAARLGADLDLGLGAVWEGDPGKMKHLDDRVMVAWASYRTTLGIDGPGAGSDWKAMKTWADEIDQWFMVGGSLRAGWDETLTTGNVAEPQIKADRLAAWVGLERYTKNSRMSAEVGRERIHPSASADDAFKGSRTRWLVSWDQQVSVFGLWLTLSYGEAEGNGFLKGDKTTRIGFKFAEPAVANVFGGLK